MNRRVIGIGLLAVLLGSASFFGFINNREAATDQPRVAVLVPLEHEAMQQMVAGFRQQLQAELSGNVQIDVKNAQGDVGIQRALLAQFAQSNYDVVAVIGTTASLMAVQLFASTFASAANSSSTPIVALDVTANLAQQRGNFTGTLEADVQATLHYMHRAFAQVHMLSLVYTAEDKSYQQAKQFVQQAKALGLVVQELMVQQPADLYTVGGLVDKHSQMIVVLKDHMVASGIAPLLQRANQQRIPLMAADDGTVRSGAALAVAVAEADIGKQGARLTAEILHGRKAADIAMRPLQQQTLFVNKAAAAQQRVDVAQAVQTAKQMGYRVQYVSDLGKQPANKS